MIGKHIGRLPESLTGAEVYIQSIELNVASLEFQCKKWIFETSIFRNQLSEMFNDTQMISTNPSIEDDY
jgi:hypothetical protein